MKKKLLTVMATGLFLCCMAGMASAVPITIENASFESFVLAESVWNTTVEGWVTNTSIHSGTYHPPDGKYTGNIVPDGHQVAFSNYYDISQILQDDLTSDTVYTLSAYVGWRLDIPSFPNYTMELWASGVQLASISTPVQTIGTWDLITLSYTSGGGVTAGQALEIRLDSSASQVNFDMIGLDATPVSASAPVPEPATMLLFGTGLAGLVGTRLRRKK